MRNIEGLKVFIGFVLCYCLMSCYQPQGNFVDASRGLSLKVVSETSEKITVELYSTTEYADGFATIEETQDSTTARNAGPVSITKNKSLLGTTYYSAIVEIPLSVNSTDRIILYTKRGHEGFNSKRRYVPAKWWENEVIIDVDKTSGKIRSVSFQ